MIFSIENGWFYSSDISTFAYYVSLRLIYFLKLSIRLDGFFLLDLELIISLLNYFHRS